MKITFFRISPVFIGLFALVTTTYSAPAYSAVIELVNGDRLSGVLKEATEQQIVWQSDVLGEVFIPADQVVDLSRYLAETQSIKTEEEKSWRNSGSAALRLYKEDKVVTKSKSDFEFKTFFEKAEHRHQLLLEYENDLDEFDHADEEYKLAHEYSWFFEPQWFLSTLLQWERNDANNLEEKYTAAMNLGYQYWSTETHHLEVAVGTGYVARNFFDKTNSGKDEYPVGLWSLDWWYKPVPQVKMFHQHDLLQSFDSGSDYEIDTESGIRMLFTASLFAEIKYEWDYDATAASTANRQQSKWLIGLGYDW